MEVWARSRLWGSCRRSQQAQPPISSPTTRNKPSSALIQRELMVTKRRSKPTRVMPTKAKLRVRIFDAIAPEGGKSSGRSVVLMVRQHILELTLTTGEGRVVKNASLRYRRRTFGCQKKPAG